MRTPDKPKRPTTPRQLRPVELALLTPAIAANAAHFRLYIGALPAGTPETLIWSLTGRRQPRKSHATYRRALASITLHPPLIFPAHSLFVFFCPPIPGNARSPLIPTGRSPYGLRGAAIRNIVRTLTNAWDAPPADKYTQTTVRDLGYLPQTKDHLSYGVALARAWRDVLPLLPTKKDREIVEQAAEHLRQRIHARTQVPDTLPRARARVLVTLLGLDPSPQAQTNAFVRSTHPPAAISTLRNPDALFESRRLALAQLGNETRQRLYEYAADPALTPAERKAAINAQNRLDAAGRRACQYLMLPCHN